MDEEARDVTSESKVPGTDRGRRVKGARAGWWLEREKDDAVPSLLRGSNIPVRRTRNSVCGWQLGL